jgi:hypothetical protein
VALAQLERPGIASSKVTGFPTGTRNEGALLAAARIVTKGSGCRRIAASRRWAISGVMTAGALSLSRSPAGSATLLVGLCSTLPRCVLQAGSAHRTAAAPAKKVAVFMMTGLLSNKDGRSETGKVVRAGDAGASTPFVTFRPGARCAP